MFFKYFSNVSIEDDEEMVSFDVNSLNTNILIIDEINIIKDHVNNCDQYTTKTTIQQQQFLELVNLVLTTT